MPNPDVHEYEVEDTGIPLVDIAPVAPRLQTAEISSPVETETTSSDGN
jgi:hypothetical protein